MEGVASAGPLGVSGLVHLPVCHCSSLINPKRERLSQACTTSRHHQPLRHHWPPSPKLAFSKAKPCGLQVALLPAI